MYVPRRRQQQVGVFGTSERDKNMRSELGLSKRSETWQFERVFGQRKSTEREGIAGGGGSLARTAEAEL